MGAGARFFGTDFCEMQLGGDATVSSNDTKKWFAFDGLPSTRWFSDSEDSDGNQVTLERDFGFSREIDSFYAWKTNIKTEALSLFFQYWNGSTWVDVNTSNATIIKSDDEMYVFAKLNTPVTTQKVRIIGEDTITADEEKYVTEFHAFKEIGQFIYRPDIKAKINMEQSVFQLDRGKGFIIEKGDAFEATIEFKSHVNQSDITLAETLFDRKAGFWLWINAGDSAQFTYSFKPYRFQDIYKVGAVKDQNPYVTKNYYKAGYNCTMKLIELA